MAQYQYDPRDFDNSGRGGGPQHYEFREKESQRPPPQYAEDVRYQARGPRGYIEESYTRVRERSRGPPRGGRNRDYYDESDGDDDEDWDVQVRRYPQSRSRARSLDAPRSRSVYDRDDDGKVIRYDVRRREVDSDSSSSSDEAYHSDRRSTRSGKSGKSHKSSNSKAIVPANPGAKPCSVACVDNANRPKQPAGPRAFPEPDSDSDYDSEEAAKAARKRRYKRVAYGTLAGMATVNACNTLYQNSKGFKNRRAAINRGEMCSAEAKLQKRNMLMEDAFAVAVMGIGVNNVIKGWKRNQNLARQDQEVREKWERKRERMEQKLLGGPEDDEDDDPREMRRHRSKSMSGRRDRY